MVGDSTPEGRPEAKKESPDFAAFVTRILEQLSVSAWLPAAMLIGVGAVLVQLRIAGNLDVPAAIAALANPASWGIIIVLLFGLVVATMVTQAFSFGIIRLLEGYWAAGRVPAWFVRARVARHVKRAKRTRSRTRTLEQELLKSALPHLAGEDPRHLQVWNEQLHVPKRERKLRDPDLLRAANSIDWRKKGDPGLAALFYKSHSRQADYPEEPTRILPTRLGNVLRSSEEPLGLQGHALERFIMEHYNQIPTRLMSQHDQFRDRLDMYALLVLVFTALAITGVPLTWEIAWPWPWLPSPAVAFVSLAILAWMSYEAAVASARGYGSTLLAINHTIKQTEGTPAQDAH